MKGDFSRLRFNLNRNYTSVLQQQGRVALDSDSNEQCSIYDYLRRTESVDVIGVEGAPVDDAGFAIQVSGNTIEIGKGRYYVRGLLCRNENLLSYSNQPCLINPNPTDAQLLEGLTQGSLDVIQLYLQVWQRLVTDLDDPCLREPALGQADTTVRIQTVWRVIAVSIPAQPPTSTGATGGSISPILNRKGNLLGRLDALREQANVRAIREPERIDCCKGMSRKVLQPPRGKLSVPPIGISDDCSCQPTPSAGYRGLENQLYRVEIHLSGDEGSATFKWSRDNGSVVSSITAISGKQVYVDSLGPDTNLGFSPGQWVEISDDSYILGQEPNQPGTLYQIQSISPETLSVTMTQPVTAVSMMLNPRMRRWDQFGPMVAGSGDMGLSDTPVDLENGIQVEFTKGQYVSGDYWLIPARTATGEVEWPPCESDGSSFQPPHITEIYEAPLACITLRNGSPFVQDCRTKFPPLTDITANYVYYDPQKCSQLKGVTTVQEALDKLCSGLGGPCTIVPQPGDGWEKPLLALKAGQDADICFPVGSFPLKQTLVLKGLGNLRLSGGGPGTMISATGLTAAIIFFECKSVQISDLAATTDTVRTRKNRGTEPPLGGTLSFADCPHVTVESVQLKCGFAEERAAACIDVENSFSSQPGAIEPVRLFDTSFGEARIRHCNLSVGRNQDGILLVRVQRAEVEDNILTAYANPNITFRDRLNNRLFRANALRELISDVAYLKQQPAKTRTKKSAAGPATEASVTAPTKAGATAGSQASSPVQKKKLNATLEIGKQSIAFQTHPLLKTFWQQHLSQNAPKQFSNQRDLLLFARKAALKLLLDPKRRAGQSAIAGALASLEKSDQVAMARGIAVGGESIQECRILNNSIQDAVQGITVGMSNHKNLPHRRESAKVVTISGNQIFVGLPPGAQFHARHAIFVGNTNSLLIENNYSRVLANHNQVSIQAISLWGVFGPRVIVRHCHLAGFNVGIIMEPLPPLPKTEKGPLWFVGENMVENAVPVFAPGNVIQENNLA